jgi:hypothetical protein
VTKTLFLATLLATSASAFPNDFECRGGREHFYVLGVLDRSCDVVKQGAHGLYPYALGAPCSRTADGWQVETGDGHLVFARLVREARDGVPDLYHGIGPSGAEALCAER